MTGENADGDDTNGERRSTDEAPGTEPSGDATDDGDGADDDVRERLSREADRAIEGFDESVVDLLSWVLDTETRARIYVHLRREPDSTSQEIADGTGLYPSTVREALAALHGDGTVRRRKRESDGAGNNPYEYAAIPPSELVGDVVEDVQAELNTVFNLDSYLRGDDHASGGEDGRDDPVTIDVRGSDDGEADDEADPTNDRDRGSDDADPGGAGSRDADDGRSGDAE